MIKSLYDFSLMDLLPESLTSDIQIRACIEGLDEELRKLSRDVKETLILSRINELPEDVIDLLAWQFAIPFYQPVGLDLSTKRKLVKNAIEDHRIRGTPAAVEKLFADVFDGAVVKEWWEFGGNPYEFRIEQIGRTLATESDYQDFHLALNVAKNVRSHLESFTVKVEQILRIFVGIVNYHLEVKQAKYRFTLKPMNINHFIGSTTFQSENQNWKYNLRLKPINLQLVDWLTNSNFESQYFHARQSDFPIHDLRATSILDLLMLGLGIVRESGVKTPIWIFEDLPLFQNFVGSFLARSEIHRYPNRINLASMLHNTQGIFTSTLEMHGDKNRIQMLQNLNLDAYIFVATNIIHQIRKMKEIPQSVAKISINSNLNLFSQNSMLMFEDRKSIRQISIDANVVSRIGAMIVTNIIQSVRSKSQPSKDPILLHLDQSLSIAPYFSRYSFETSRTKFNADQHLSLDLANHLSNSIFAQTSVKHKSRDIQTESKLYIGVTAFRGICQSMSMSKTDKFIAIEFDNETKIAFQNFRFETKYTKIRSDPIQNRLQTKICFNLFESVIHHFKPPFNSTSKTLFFDNSLNLNAGLTSHSLHVQKSRLKSSVDSTSDVYAGFVLFRTAILHSHSKDSPVLVPIHISQSMDLNYFADFCSAKFQSVKTSNRKFPSMSFNLYSSENFVQVADKKLNLPRKINLNLATKVELFSSRSIIKSILSSFRIPSISPMNSNFNLYHGFVPYHFCSM